MIQYHIYPGGTRRIVTFSYDDGHENDRPLIAIFNKYGVKGTFHLNGINYIDKTDKELSELGKLYSNHEIACHTLHHGWPSRMPMQAVVNEVMEDRKILEKIAGYPVIGMSYPSGSYDNEVISAMKACGIVYSRTTTSNKNYAIPLDFMEWHPTCHHSLALDLCGGFMDNLDSQWYSPLFYVWGHSYEYREDKDWKKLEELLDIISHNEKIWYATNIEIYNYMTAQRMLQITVDEKIFYNPTSIDVWVEKDKKDVICIPAGQTVTI